jgi:HCOMODA/2-hydroxy-3-carboxy-muconic semialdehyde decarboxylase
VTDSAPTAGVQEGNGLVVQAGRVLSALGLVTAFGHVSARTDTRMIITPAADLADVGPADLVEMDLTATALPAGAPAEAWAHLRVYAARPDVNAIARAQPPAAFAAAAALTGQPPIAQLPIAQLPIAQLPIAQLPLLHGQACWLGTTIPVHDDARLLRSVGLAEMAVAALGRSNALLLRGNGALTCGATPGHATARMWLVAAACETWLAASASGEARTLTAAEVESWRSVEGELLPRLWLHLSRMASDKGWP